MASLVRGVPGIGKYINLSHSGNDVILYMTMFFSAVLIISEVFCWYYRFCRGCKVECNAEDFNFGSSFLAIDWEPTALHLRYQTALERVCFTLS
jgi:hypothetical protein